MEARNLRPSELVGVIRSKGAISEVVRGKRAVSKNQAKALAEFFTLLLDYLGGALLSRYFFWQNRPIYGADL